MQGNIFGTLYFLYFQLAGILAASFVLEKENSSVKLLAGSSFGSLLMHWLPVLASFVLDFSVAAHIAAAVAVMPLFVIALYHKKYIKNLLKGISVSVKANKMFAVLFVTFLVLWGLLLDSHIIRAADSGAIYTGQSTYGDMNMHLGFVTSIANQGAFPPQYSIFPGTKLAYPFLNAAVSSSIYIWGASLRWAYILPMVAAFMQVMGMVYLLSAEILADKSKAVCSWVLFFLNGGLGFAYFIGIGDSGLSFKELFTGFYKTPTNLVDFNIRWANIIADILLPQRASLFGYAMLFTALWLLYTAVWKGKRVYYIYAALFAGALPMIHTHSFLAAGLVSAAWLLLDLYKGAVTEEKQRYFGAELLAAFVLLMCVLQHLNGKNLLASKHFFAIGIAGIAACVLYGIWLMTAYIRKNGWHQLAGGWGVYLAVTAALAIPQLLFWTFGQVAEGGFLRGHFNWGNLGDFYPWFYLKNIGVPLAVIVAAICKGGKNTAKLAVPAGVIWFVAELILFTPNTYDNNKLLYVAYLLLCIAGADFAMDWYRAHKGGLARIAGTVFMVLCTVSAVLTLGRELISDYKLYGSDHMALVQYVEENTDTTDVFLTGIRHNNEIAALTGCSIVCGSDMFLYYHGIDTSQRKKDVKAMYESPADSVQLYEKYGVDYVVVSSWERADYYIDEPLYSSIFEQVFHYGGVTLYKVK